MPFTAIIYLLCYLDRSNIGKWMEANTCKECLPTHHTGNARILNSTTNDTLLDTHNMTQYEYIIALMVFLVAYSLFEAPSNLALKALSPNVSVLLLIY